MSVGANAVGKLAVGASESGASVGSISITTPVAGKIHQRSGTTGTITVTGTYTGTPTTIEARLVDDGTNTPVSGFDWSTKVASPSGSAYAFSFTSAPQGGWYNVQVRHSNNTGVTATSGKVGVGALIALTGQSNAYLWFRNRSTALTPNSLVRAFGLFGTWSVPDTAAMAGAIAFGNALATALSIPIGVLDYAADSSYLHNYSSNSWLPITNAPYVAFKAGALTGLDGKLEAIVWVQGESDVIQNATQAQYYADLGTLFTAFRTDSGQSSLPIVMVTLGRWLNDVRVTNTNIQDVRLAQVQKCADADVYRVDRMDLPLSGDDLHLSGPGFETLGTRCAQVVSYLSGVATYYQGPRISSVTQVSTSVYDVDLTHNSSATDFTPTSGITGFRVLDSGTPATISTAVRQSANTVRLTLASPSATTPVVQYLYGYGPDITGVLLDNSTLTLPLEFNGGVQATTGVAVTVTGLLGTSALGTVSVTAVRNVSTSVTGLLGTSALGTVTVTTGGDTSIIVNVIGLSGTASLGNVLVWGLVDTTQTPNWTRIAT
jgi:hypothetical protein